jgi:thermostable 8-oxoguanine DNA glycosylase
MINAREIINFHRSEAEMEELILFLVCVAGKNADTTSRLLDSFFYTKDFDRVSPFQQIREMDTVYGMLGQRIRNARLGCYGKLEKAFRQLANSNLNLYNCKLEELMSIHGVGRKSASCFLAWTRKDVKVAMLDTHLLKYLRQVQDNIRLGSFDKWKEYRTIVIPKSTPSSKKLYDTLEKFYLEICEFRKVNPTEFDLEIWKHYAGKN